MKELPFVILLVAGTLVTTLAQRIDDTTLNQLVIQTAQTEAKLTDTNRSLGVISDAYNPVNPRANVRIETASVSGHLLCIDSTSKAIVKGTIVDPQEPDFEMYTNKIVLLRESFLPTGMAEFIRTLKDILSAEPKAIIILTESETGVNTLEGFPTCAIPIVSITLKDSSEIILAVRNRRQVSLEIN